jgi:site-specific DNA-cytosine methylase
MIPMLAATLTQGAPSAGRRNEDDVNLVAFAQNQRDEVRELGDLAGGLQSEPGMKQQTYVVQDTTRMAKDQNGAGVSDEDVSYTLDGQSRPGVAASSVRRLTPLECERLQGFLDGWTDIPGNSDTQRYRQLGNAVAVPVAEWLLGRIVAYEETL